MASFNRVVLMGNLTSDPEVRQTNGGTSVCEVTLAVNRKYYDKSTQQQKEEVAFIGVILWGRQAELAGEYLSKGRSLLVEGRLTQDSWEDKDTGKKRTKTKVTAEKMEFVGSGDSGGTQQPRQQQQDYAPTTSEDCGF